VGNLLAAGVPDASYRRVGKALPTQPLLAFALNSVSGENSHFQSRQGYLLRAKQAERQLINQYLEE